MNAPTEGQYGNQSVIWATLKWHRGAPTHTMLTTLRFAPPPPDLAHAVLGVLVSQNLSRHAVQFSVPGHVLWTLNVVQGGSMQQLDSHGRQTSLPQTFATAACQRAQRYSLSAGASIATLFGRLEALDDRTSIAQVAVAVPATTHPPGMQAATELEAPLFSTARRLAVPANQAPSATIRRIGQALAALQSRPMPSLAQAAASLHTTPRSLQRLFATHWGVPLKLVQRLLRVQQATHLWQAANGQMPLAELAAALGLSDQAHLAKEFRELVGEPPSALGTQSTGPAQVAKTSMLWALNQGAQVLTPAFLASYGVANFQDNTPALS